MHEHERINISKLKFIIMVYDGKDNKAFWNRAKALTYVNKDKPLFVLLCRSAIDAALEDECGPIYIDPFLNMCIRMYGKTVSYCPSDQRENKVFNNWKSKAKYIPT